jgi:putative holliday junction resolvase
VLAFDYGSKRIGVAVSDSLRITAGPLEVIPTDAAMTHVRRLVEEYLPDVVVVGLPIGLSGNEGAAAEDARRFGTRIQQLFGVSVEYVDERFSTRTAEQAMIEGGVKRRDRRAGVDKVAASVILRQYLERAR